MTYLQMLFGKKIIEAIVKAFSKPKDEHEGIADSVTSIDNQLINDEGLRLKPYKDSKGILTIGVGHNLTNGISRAAVMFIFREDLNNAIKDAEKLPFYSSLGRIRQNIIVNMVFNMGLPTFKKFTKTIRAIENKNYKEASKQMMDSKWATQVGKRATRLSKEMLKGV